MTYQPKVTLRPILDDNPLGLIGGPDRDWVDIYDAGLNARTAEKCRFVGAIGAIVFDGPDGPHWGPDGHCDNYLRGIDADGASRDRA